MTFRSFLFWLHLVAGLISGLSIGIMCFTGTVLAFEKQLVAWSERDARQVSVPAPGTPRLSLDDLSAKLRAAQPDARPQSIVVQNDPLAAVAFTTGRSGGFYANPYTGEIRQPASSRMADFMHLMTDWHRTLGLRGNESRPVGKLINGICNLAFCVLAVTGLYLWMPRQWSWRALRSVVWFRATSTAKARDFNWHNVIGLWSAPVLIVLTLTAVPISFRWGGTLIYTLTGTPAPAAGNAGPGGGGPGGNLAPAIEVIPPSPDAKPLAPDALLAAVQKQTPDWQTLTLRTANAGAGGRGGRGGAGRDGAAPSAPTSAEASSAPRTAPSTPAFTPTPADIVNRKSEIINPSAVSITVRESTSWPRTANTTLSANPYTGEILRRTGYADQNAAQQVRSWTRFLHTGEALGPVGQWIAGLACLGGLFLVYTGFALSWRRFFG